MLRSRLVDVIKDTRPNLTEKDEDDRANVRVLQHGTELERCCAVELLDDAEIGRLAFQ